MAKIFLTGVTGFLGSNIARNLIKDGHSVIATYRKASSKSSCRDFESKIHWVLQEGEKWMKTIKEYQPEIVIHCAWIGVSHADRDCWKTQYKNVDYLNLILSIAKKSNSSSVVVLGSQAEYGVIEGCINEDHALMPTEAYGCIKVICSEIVKQFCNYNNIQWYWLRLFSFFGKGEASNWLIPTLVTKILTSEHMDLTPGEQKYAYLYVDDLAYAINNVIKHYNNASGVYNISGSKAIKLKDIIQKVTSHINPSFQLNFGKLPYRTNQPMHLQGDSKKFIKIFGEFEKSDFDNSLYQTILHLRNSYNNKTNNESI
jgi:nucleoside-diphosphate-sugar epimerase